LEELFDWARTRPEYAATIASELLAAGQKGIFLRLAKQIGDMESAYIAIADITADLQEECANTSLFLEGLARVKGTDRLLSEIMVVCILHNREELVFSTIGTLVEEERRECIVAIGTMLAAQKYDNIYCALDAEQAVICAARAADAPELFATWGQNQPSRLDCNDQIDCMEKLGMTYGLLFNNLQNGHESAFRDVEREFGDTGSNGFAARLAENLAAEGFTCIYGLESLCNIGLDSILATGVFRHYVANLIKNSKRAEIELIARALRGMSRGRADICRYEDKAARGLFDSKTDERIHAHYGLLEEGFALFMRAVSGGRVKPDELAVAGVDGRNYTIVCVRRHSQESPWEYEGLDVLGDGHALLGEFLASQQFEKRSQNELKELIMAATRANMRLGAKASAQV
jgi:hypothetical protein